MKNYLKKFGISFLVIFLLAFMIFIFGPTEIYFSNLGQFEFLFQEYIFVMTGIGIGIALILGIAVAFLPDKVYKIILSAVCGLGLASYAQVMFFNKNLDLLGLNPDGYSVSVGALIINLLIWIVIVAAVVLAVIKKEDISNKILIGIPAFLVTIQIVAFASLIPGADESAFERPEGSYFLTGENQFKLSENDNVLVFILDYFSNQYVDKMLAKYPDAIDYLNDFTYYDNDECVYHGTYPSIAHMLTGQEIDPSIPVNEWTSQIWQSETVNEFYKVMAKEQNYNVEVYTPESWVLRGDNDVTIFDGIFDNLTNSSQEIELDRKLLVTTMSKMAMYRMSPEILKNCFYTNNGEVLNIVSETAGEKAHEDAEFYDRVLGDGLTVSGDKNMLQIHHLEGAHAWTVDENCHTKEDATLEETCMGCMVMMSAYLDELKRVGKYDDTTIIITSDHGSEREPQVIMYIKEPGEKHDKMQVSHAPISHCNLLPTLAYYMGADTEAYGIPINEIAEEPVTRLYFLHTYDDRYPSVKTTDGTRDGAYNVYYAYQYTGDYSDLLREIDKGAPETVIPMVDAPN